MQPEEQIKELITAKYGNVRAFATENNISYTTVRSILERGIMNAKAENVFNICRILGISPDSLVDWANGTTNIVLGDNHGVNNLDAGNGNTNNYNFGNQSQAQDDHNETMRNLGATDVRMTRQLINRLDAQIKIQQITNDKLDRIIELLEEK